MFGKDGDLPNKITFLIILCAYRRCVFFLFAEDAGLRGPDRSLRLSFRDTQSMDEPCSDVAVRNLSSPHSTDFEYIGQSLFAPRAYRRSP